MSVAPARAGQLPGALVAYALVLAGFLLVPPYLKASVGPPTAFTLQEAVDLFTPLVVIPLAWRVYQLIGPPRLGLLAFLVVAALWIEGQAIHLAANAIGDAFSPTGAKAFYETPPGDLDHWLDETLSHWMWHVAWVALSIPLLAAATGGPARASAEDPGLGPRLATIGAGIVHGATFFLVTVEGVTTLLGIPASIVLLAWSSLAARRGMAGHPVVTFFQAATVVTLLGYLVWGALHNWTLPEFSKVGLFG